MRVLDSVDVGHNRICLVTLGGNLSLKYYIESWVKSRRLKLRFNRVILLSILNDGTVSFHNHEMTDHVKLAVDENLQKWCDLVRIDHVTTS